MLDNDILKLIGGLADELGLPCYVVGGYVRDHFLGVPSSPDIDIVVVGDMYTLARRFSEISGCGKVDIFKTYGTAKVDYFDTQVEFVAARKESYNRNSRNPIVEPGTIGEDLARRDFTINAIAVCLNENNYGQVLDPFAGRSDIKRGVVKTPQDPNITFFDDPLRMLRAIRFCTKFEFTISGDTYESIERNSKRLDIITPERISQEFLKILGGPDPARGIHLLRGTKLLERFLPEVCALDTVDDGKHKNNFHHTLEVLDNISQESDNIWLRFAALLHDIGKDRCKKQDPITGSWTFYGHPEIGARMVKGIFKRLKLPLDKMEYVQKLVGLHMRPQKIAEDGVTDTAVRRVLVEAGDDISDLLLLSRCDITTKYSDKKERLQGAIDLLEQKIADLKEKDWRRMFQPCVNGYDLMEIFGLTKGPTIGILKDAMKEAILDGKIPNEREALIQFATELYNKEII